MNRTCLHRAVASTQPQRHFPLISPRSFVATTSTRAMYAGWRLLRQKFRNRPFDISRLRPDDIPASLPIELDS